MVRRFWYGLAPAQAWPIEQTDGSLVQGSDAATPTACPARHRGAHHASAAPTRPRAGFFPRRLGERLHDRAAACHARGLSRARDRVRYRVFPQSVRPIGSVRPRNARARAPRRPAHRRTSGRERPNRARRVRPRAATGPWTTHGARDRRPRLGWKAQTRPGQTARPRPRRRSRPARARKPARKGRPSSGKQPRGRVRVLPRRRVRERDVRRHGLRPRPGTVHACPTCMHARPARVLRV